MGDVAIRAKGLVLAMMTPDLAKDSLFEHRARFYRMGGIVADARKVFDEPNHSFWETINTMRRDFGVPEGYLADQV